MEDSTSTIIGSTGLIGSRLLELMVNDDYYNSVRIIVRRPLQVSNPKIQVHVIDFTDRQAFKQAIAGSDAVFCAVGTTQKKVKGDKDAYRKVDYEIPVTAAELCAETGVEQFLLVTSMGSNSKSKNFYIKLKGESEDAIRKINIPSIAVFRPSMLLGKRQEKRFGEKIFQRLMKTFSFMIPAKYKAVEARDVAKAMIEVSKRNLPGFRIYQNDELRMKNDKRQGVPDIGKNKLQLQNKFNHENQAED
jgi:uncharacterized protein YbjT (DUF2867 family)